MPRKAEMPKTITIAGRRIKLVEEKPALHKDIGGIHDVWANQITVYASLAEDQKRAVAVHEIVHDIEAVTGVEMSEQDVTSFASVLFAVLRDNPALVKWLMS